MPNEASVLRAAIYCRKSSEEGLEQSFNNLHAQREACEAFVTSQRQEGWCVLPSQYDDGGYVGNTNVSYAVRQHQMYSLDFGPEITALAGRVRPYGYATAGISYFRSTMNVRPPEYDGDDGVDRTIFSAGNFAWSTGVGLRVGPRNTRSGAFDIGIRFRRNARAHYANDRSLSSLSSGSVVVNPFYGSANVITIYAGAWIGPRRLR